jgi:hypothetical protein
VTDTPHQYPPFPAVARARVKASPQGVAAILSEAILEADRQGVEMTPDTIRQGCGLLVLAIGLRAAEDVLHDQPDRREEP